MPTLKVGRWICAYTMPWHPVLLLRKKGKANQQVRRMLAKKDRDRKKIKQNNNNKIKRLGFSKLKLLT